MMSHFPIRYEDEIMYSVVSRYSIRSGNTSHRATLIDVFGSIRFTVCIELQPGIRRIISNLPVGSTVTEEQLIFENTMYSFYCAFKSDEQRSWIKNEMLADHGRDLYNAIGQASSSLKPTTHFQYCPVCNKISLEKYGELYWRRIFLIPGVRICVEHGIWLCKSDIPIRGITKHTFTVPTLDICSNSIAQVVTDTKLLALYRYIVNGIVHLLNREYPSRPFDWFYSCYKKQLIRKGYVSGKGKVEQKRVKQDFVDYFGVELLDIFQSPVVGEYNWLKSMFQKHRIGKEFHPIRHLLVMTFLGLSLEDVFYAYEPQLISEKELQIDRPKRKIMKKTMTKEYKEQSKKERREAWTLMRSRNPHLGRLELRKLNPKIYAWLYLYDREYLLENMPEKQPTKSGVLRYDWKKRDEEVYQRAKDIVETFLDEEEKPKRISVMRIQERLGENCLMPKHLKKMPKTKEYLSEVVEDAERFRQRRILWAIQELQKEEESLTLNRIKIKAGVRGVEEFMLEHPDMIL